MPVTQLLHAVTAVDVPLVVSVRLNFSCATAVYSWYCGVYRGFWCCCTWGCRQSCSVSVWVWRLLCSPVADGVFFRASSNMFFLFLEQFSEEVVGARSLVRTSIEKKLKEEAKLAK